MKDFRVLRMLGIIGLTGATIMFIGDMLFFGSFTNSSGSDFMANYVTKLGTIAPEQIRLASLLGPLAVPFYLVGFAQVFRALKPAGKGWALITFVFFVISVVLIGCYHFSVGYISYISQLKMGLGATNSEAFNEFEALCWQHNYSLYSIGTLCAQIAVALLFYVVLIYKTHYPGKIIYLTPLALLFIGNSLPELVPAPVGGFLVAGYSNLIFMGFFAVVTIVLKKNVHE